jgi:hypothetical protein
MIDIKWKRIKPGHYESVRSYNGYSYRIYRAAPGWPYALEYRWDKDSTATWRRPRTYYSHMTIAGCKRSASAHNAQPRERWVFLGRVEQHGQEALAFKPAGEHEDSTMKSRYYLTPDEVLRPLQRPLVPFVSPADLASGAL